MTTADSLQLSSPSLLVRLGVVLYEAFLLFSVLLLFFIPFVFFTNSTEENMNPWVNRLYFFIILGLYFTFHWWKGKTLAMQTWRIIICNADGSRLHPAKAFVRYLLAWPLTISTVGWIWMYFDAEHQLLQDRLLGTRIYRLTIIKS